MYAKIKNFFFDDVLPNIRDMRVISLLVLGVLAALTTWNGIQLIEVNYKLQQEIAALEAKNRITALENDNLRLKSEYLKTDTYLELIARSQFSKGAEGETLVLIPKDVALAHVPDIEEENTATKQAKQLPAYIENLQAWRDFYFPGD